MESQRNAPPNPAKTADRVQPSDERLEGEGTPVPSVVELTALRTDLEHRQQATVSRVGALVREQKTLTSSIADDITVLRRDGDTLHQLERVEQEEVGLLVGLSRRIGRRGRMLERRTVAARLHEQYSQVHTTLRKASAFTDELRLCAVELAEEIDQLHGSVEDSLAESVRMEARVGEIDAELQGMAEVGDATLQRSVDRLCFEQADLRTAAGLHEAKARLCAQELEPVRKLRETVHSLHQEMAHYVLNASGSIEGSGRRIQALGLAADAPVVVSELQAGLDHLDQAMVATTAYLEQAHDMLTRVLPELSEHIRTQGTQAALDLEAGIVAIEQARSSDASDADLRAAARAEVELLGIEGDGQGPG